MGYINSARRESIILWSPSIQHIKWLYPFLMRGTPYRYKNLSTAGIQHIFDIEDILDMDTLIQNGSPVPDKLIIYEFSNPSEIHFIGRVFFGVKEDEPDDMSCTSKCIWMYQGFILRCRHHPYVECMNREYARSLQWWDLPEELYIEAKENGYSIYNSIDTDMKCTALFLDEMMKYIIYNSRDGNTVILSNTSDNPLLFSVTRESTSQTERNVPLGFSRIIYL